MDAKLKLSPILTPPPIFIPEFQSHMYNFDELTFFRPRKKNMETLRCAKHKNYWAIAQCNASDPSNTKRSAFIFIDIGDFINALASKWNGILSDVNVDYAVEQVNSNKQMKKEK